MGQAGEKREESARGEGGLGLRAAAEAWGMGPLTALHYTAVLRSVELCSAVLLNYLLTFSDLAILWYISAFLIR